MTLQAIVLGVVQGFSEFLPVSSSAHLVLIPYFFSWDDPGLAFDVALHMGTLGAVLLYFWRDWIELLKAGVKPREGAPMGRLTLVPLVLGTIPAAVAGLLFEKQAEHAFRSPILIAVTMAVFGLLLFYFDRKGKRDRDFAHFTTKDALIVGCAQALAIVPGVSRSGITITAALALGLGRTVATRFSFLLSAPIIAGAGVMKAKHILIALTSGGEQAFAVIVGFTASLITGFLAIWMLTYIIKARTFTGFVVYRVLLALVIIAVVVGR